MLSRITLLAAIAAITVSASAPAEAHRSYRTAPSIAPKIDVAAIPAYPLEQSSKGYRQPRQIGPHARKAVREAISPTQTERAAPEPRQPESGVVRSAKTGATARVSPRFAATAQAVVDDLEQNHGAIIKFMGGYRSGPCASWSLHPCGLAIDLCQLSRGVVDARCQMPSRAIEERVARAHGAYSGGEWCSQDRGHIQAQATASPCGTNLYAAVSKFKTTELAAHRIHLRHRHRVRLAHG